MPEKPPRFVDNPTTPHTLLVVDDDVLITVTLSAALRSAGYRVLEATSVDRALELCAQERIDLAILDQQMPGMSGSELARLLKERHALHSIFLSAYSSPELVDQAVEAGAICYLLKPVDPPDMLPAIRAALSRVSELRALRERESQLTTALMSNREVGIAVGILMERMNTTHTGAFEMLRRYARSHRIKVAEVAGNLVQGTEQANRIVAAILNSEPPANAAS